MCFQSVLRLFGFVLSLIFAHFFRVLICNEKTILMTNNVQTQHFFEVVLVFWVRLLYVYRLLDLLQKSKICVKSDLRTETHRYFDESQI